MARRPGTRTGEHHPASVAEYTVDGLPAVRGPMYVGERSLHRSPDGHFQPDTAYPERTMKIWVRPAAVRAAERRRPDEAGSGAQLHHQQPLAGPPMGVFSVKRALDQRPLVTSNPVGCVWQARVINNYHVGHTTRGSPMVRADSCLDDAGLAGHPGQERDCAERELLREDTTEGVHKLSARNASAQHFDGHPLLDPPRIDPQFRCCRSVVQSRQCPWFDRPEPMTAALVLPVATA
jgi:hypothetical protein